MMCFDILQDTKWHSRQGVVKFGKGMTVSKHILDSLN
jgi:hypothetical protein